MKPRIVIIDEAIHLEDPKALHLWQRTLWVKCQSYGQTYQSGFLPVSTDDFFATHYILADEGPKGDLEPLAMFKSTSKARADRYGVPFGLYSMLSLAKDVSTSDVVSLVESPKRDARGAPEDVAYLASWTINPKYQGNKELSLKFKDYMCLMALLGHSEAGVYRWFCGGTLQYKVDRLLASVGAKPFLPPFKLPKFDNQVIQLMYLKDTRVIPRSLEGTFEELQVDWERRLVFSPSKQTGSQAA